MLTKSGHGLPGTTLGSHFFVKRQVNTAGGISVNLCPLASVKVAHLLYIALRMHLFVF